MAPLSADAITHFTHPAHKLNYLTTNTSFLCDGCQVPGTGPRFICTICSFDLHEYCAKCPSRLTSTTTHTHPMSLVVHKPDTNLAQCCQNCRNPVKGLAYHCKDCNFWVHPLCVSTNNNNNNDNNNINRHHTVPNPSSGSVQAGQRIGEQIGVGLATNYIYDQLKGEPDENPSTGSNAHVSGDQDPTADTGEVPLVSVDAGVVEDDGGFFGAIKSGFKSMFESVSDS